MRQAGLCVWQAHQIAARHGPPRRHHRRDRRRGRPSTSPAAAPSRCSRTIRIRTPAKSPFPAVTCISVNDEVVHGIPTDKPLVEGDIVSIDTGCRLNGWCGDSASTYPVGQHRARGAAAARRHRGRARPGDRADGTPRPAGAQVAREMDTYVRDHGFSAVEMLRRPRHRPRDARRPAGAEFRQPQPPRQRRFPPRAGPGDRRRADGEHGHQAREEAARPLDAGRPPTASPAPISSTRSPSPATARMLLTGPRPRPKRRSARRLGELASQIVAAEPVNPPELRGKFCSRSPCGTPPPRLILNRCPPLRSRYLTAPCLWLQSGRQASVCSSRCVFDFDERVLP